MKKKDKKDDVVVGWSAEDWLFFLLEPSENPPEDLPLDQEAVLSDEPPDANYIIEDEFDEYYITLQGTPFPDDAILRCDYCLAPIEAYDGKLERCYAWFSVHRQSGDLECNGLVCKRCAEKRVLPVKPAPVIEDEKYYVNKLLKDRDTSPFLASKVNR